MRAHHPTPGQIHLSRTKMEGKGCGGGCFRICPHLEVVPIAGVRGRVGVLPTKLGKVQRRSRGQLMEFQREAHGENFASKIHDGDWWALWFTLHLIFPLFFFFFPSLSDLYFPQCGPLFSRFSSTLSPCSSGAGVGEGKILPWIPIQLWSHFATSLCKHYWRAIWFPHARENTNRNLPHIFRTWIRMTQFCTFIYVFQTNCFQPLLTTNFHLFSTFPLLLLFLTFGYEYFPCF